MQLQSLDIVGFGPWRRRRFEFAPGLNVVHGPNEAGKSSLHAALVYALCGVRRGKGATAEERDLRARHQPWDGSPWDLCAVIRLADGRELEIIQDLDGRTESRALDLAFGRPLPELIDRDGALDLTTLAGMSRRVFLATASVRQSEVMAIEANPSLVREHLQRAAAGADVTAARALEVVEKYQAEHVGRHRSNSTRPWQRAAVALAGAERRLASALDSHRAHAHLVRQVGQVASDVQLRREELRQAEAMLARARLEEIEGRLAGVRRLASEAPAIPAVDEALAQSAAAALAAWGRGVHPAPPGPALADLLAELRALEMPPPPRGRRGLLVGWAVASLAGLGAVAALLAGQPLAALVAVGLGAMLLLLTLGRRLSATAGAALLQEEREVRRRQLRVRIEETSAWQERVDGEAAQAEAELIALARSCGCADSEPGAAAEWIACWLADAAQARAAAQAARQRERELADLLRGASVESLSAEAEALRARTPGAGGRVLAVSQAEADLEETRMRLADAVSALDRAQGGVETARAALPDVAEAEEALAEAQAEMARVEHLEFVLESTRKHLAEAQEAVHRDIGPALNREVARWLPAVTRGRYSEALVDPEDLGVTLLGPDGRRPVRDLSHGTREQVYLLLRMAVLDCFGRPGEPVPLLLDDVTVNSDRERTTAILSLLREVASGRQVVMFTQEDAVVEWARRELNDVRHRVIELPEPAAPAVMLLPMHRAGAGAAGGLVAP
ncbi:MAG: ATP-binding protein [Candidatus Dormibacteria bacterium]